MTKNSFVAEVVFQLFQVFLDKMIKSITYIQELPVYNLPIYSNQYVFVLLIFMFYFFSGNIKQK